MQRLNVLLVEDNDDMRALYGFMLANAGYHVKAVRNGLEAIAEIQAERPDLVVTDVAMPVLSGLELIKAVKANDELADLPVLAITSFGESFRELAMAAGANDLIDKPADEEGLCDAINNILAQRQV